MKICPQVRASAELLGVNVNATAADLKKAYYRLALLYHPDRNPRVEAESEFHKITEAYELLCDSARVAELNQKYLRGRLHSRVIEGIEISFGSFFGYRLFDLTTASSPSTALRLAGRASHAVSNSSQKSEHWLPIEENNSILDHPAFDAIEVVYAGKFSLEDEEKLSERHDGNALKRLPWVILNNQGLLKFLDGDLRSASKCYQELCTRVPNNIVFMYRLGLCYVLEGFQSPRRTLLGMRKPDRLKIDKGLALFAHCLKLAAERPVGKQKCLLIKKIMADVLEKTGRARRARNLWLEIDSDDQKCAEAAFRLKDFDRARKLIKAKQRDDGAAKDVQQRRLTYRSPEKS